MESTESKQMQLLEHGIKEVEDTESIGSAVHQVVV
jgi:hypothetical protein